MATLSEMPGAGPSTMSSPETNSHLSYYVPEKSASPPPSGAPTPSPEVSKTRLYVGNLHPSVDEYTFLQVFNKYGKIAKLDFLFHKTGPSKGKPRGYAFVEYTDKEEALKALVNAHDKLLRGKKIIVTYANQAPAYEQGPYIAGKHRRTDTQRPTALSLIKSTWRPGKTEDKIAAFEAKLRQMKKSDAAPTSSSLPSHPSLPLKPPSTIPQEDPAVNPLLRNATSSVNMQQKAAAKPGGIFASGVSASLGKKPTLEELMKTKKKDATQLGLLKR